MNNLQTREHIFGIHKFEDVLENVLEDTASRWYQTIKNEIRDIDDFETKFLNRYWSYDIQKGLKRRIEHEKYRPKGFLNRSDYFIEKVLILSHMIPKMEESEMVIILSEHFESQIQDARRVQNIKTIREFENLLNRYDIEEKNTRENLERKTEDRDKDRRNYSSKNSNGQVFTSYDRENEKAYQSNIRSRQTEDQRAVNRNEQSHSNYRNNEPQHREYQNNRNRNNDNRVQCDENQRSRPFQSQYDNNKYHNQQHDNERFYSPRYSNRYQGDYHYRNRDYKKQPDNRYFRHKTEEQEAMVQSFTLAGSSTGNANQEGLQGNF